MAMEGGGGRGGGSFQSFKRRKQADSDRARTAAEGQQLAKELSIQELVTKELVTLFLCPPFFEFQVPLFLQWKSEVFVFVDLRTSKLRCGGVSYVYAECCQIHGS